MSAFGGKADIGTDAPMSANNLHWLGYEPRAQSCKFGVADRTCLFKTFELFDLICGAEANHAPKLVTRLLSFRRIVVCHASSLKDQIGKDGNVRKDIFCEASSPNFSTMIA